MKTLSKSLTIGSLAAASLFSASCDSDNNNVSTTDAEAAAIPITITMQANGPVAFAPSFFVTHDGSFDFFDTGSVASAALEPMAELGDVSDIVASVSTDSYSTFTSGPIAPGSATTTVTLMVSEENRYFTYGSMVLPTSDTFIGNNSPTAFDLYQLLEDSADGTVTIDVSRLYDAGTEVNDFLTSPGGPLVGAPTGVDTDGVDENASITLSEPDFYNEYLNAGDFDVSTINPEGANVATITITRTDTE